MYEVTDTGKIWSYYYNLFITPEIASNGYLRIRLYNEWGSKKFPVHQLVAKAFISNPENKPQINHKDLNKTNNRVENLEWVTGSENLQHFFKYGNTAKRREASRRSGKLLGEYALKTQAKKVFQYDRAGRLIAEYLSTGKAGIATSIQQTKISACAIGKRKTAGNYFWSYKNDFTIKH